MVTRREFNQVRRTRHRKYWQILNDDGISDPFQYLARVADQSYDPEFDDERDVLDQQGLAFPVPEPLKCNRNWLSRFYPYNHQNIAFVFQDPRINLGKKKSDDIVRNEHLRLANTPLIPSAMAEVSINYYSDWLAGRGNSPSRFDKYLLPALENSSEYIDIDNRDRYYGIPPNDVSLDDDYNRKVNPRDGIWEDIYVTNIHLLAEWDTQTTLVSNEQEEELFQALQTELDALSPNLIFYAGAAWRALHNSEVELTTENGVEPGKNITEIHGSLYKSQDRFIIPIGHPSNRDDWDKHHSRLEDSLQITSNRVDM